MTQIAYAALWLFVFSVPWEGLLVSTGVSIVTKMTGAVALALALLTVVISGRIRRLRLVHLAALLFVIWAGVGVLLLHMQVVPKKYYTFVQLFLVLWMIWELAQTRRRVLGLLLAYVLGAGVASLETLFLYWREAGSLRRFAAGGADPNSLAMTLALALSMAWYLGMMHHRPLVRWICRAYLPLGVIAIGLTGSRGGMIAALVGLLIVPLAMSNLSPGKLVTAIVLLGFSGGLAVHYVPETTVERLATTGESVQSMSLGGRLRLWKAGVHAMAERPIMGYGTSTFKNAVNPELGSGSQVAHNSFISVMVEEGLIGFLLYATMLVSVFFALLRLPRLERRFSLVLLLTLIVAMLPLTWEHQKDVWVILAALIGLAQAPVPIARMARQPVYRRATPVSRAPIAARFSDRDARA
jgi:O-antigen ligase